MSGGALPVRPSRGRLTPLGFADVEITGGPWAERQRVNAAATLAHCHEWMTRLGWVGNFTDVVEATRARASRPVRTRAWCSPTRTCTS